MITALRILNTSLQPVTVFFNFISCIWTTQYFDAGEFEIVVEYNPENMSALATGNFVIKNNTNEIGVIEKVRYEYSPDEGGTITASGRMAISLLDRRLIGYLINNNHPIIYQYCAQGGNVEDYARQTVKHMAIEPYGGNNAKIIPNLILGADKGFAYTASKRVSTYQNLMTTMFAFLATKNLSQKIVYDADANKLSYEVYQGTDRSNTLVFSRFLENLNSFSYEVDKTEYKNAMFIGGDGEGTARYVATVGVNGYPSGGGLERREMFYDASSSKEDNESVSNYINIIKNEARQECKEYAIVKNVEAEIDLVNSGLEFGVDYNVGDVILIRDIVDFKPRITTVIESQSADGYTIDVEFNEDAPEEEEE